MTRAGIDDDWPRLACWGVLPVATLLLGVQLFADDYLRGVDAYYYAVQADHWFQTGRLRIPDSSVVHYLIGSLQYLGLNAENAVRVWICISLLLFYIGFYGLLLRQRRISPPLAGFLLWALLSPSLLYCALEFPKTFSFLVVCNLWFLCLGAKKTRWWLLALLMAMACALHKMALVYVAAVLGWLTLAHLDRRLRGRFAFDLVRFACWGGGVIGVLLLLGFLLPDFLHLHDLLRLKGTRLTPGVIALFLEPNLPAAIRWEFALAAGTLIALFIWQRRNPSALLLLLCLVVPSFFPAFGSEPFSLGERFGLLFPYGVLLGGAYLYGNLAEAENSLNPHGRLVVGLFVALALMGSWLRLDITHPPTADLPYAQYDRLTDRLARRELPMLILHRGMHFYYKYRTGREAFSYEPEPHWPQEKTWRLVFGVTPEELFAYLPDGCNWDVSRVTVFSGTPYSLVREDCYAGFRQNVVSDLNPALYALLWRNPMNPSEARPAFLYRKHAGDDPEDEFSALPAR